MNRMQTDYLMLQLKMLSLAVKECLSQKDQVIRIAVTKSELDEVRQFLDRNEWCWDIDSSDDNSIEFNFSFSSSRILMYNPERY